VARRDLVIGEVQHVQVGEVQDRGGVSLVVEEVQAVDVVVLHVQFLKGLQVEKLLQSQVVI